LFILAVCCFASRLANRPERPVAGYFSVEHSCATRYILFVKIEKKAGRKTETELLERATDSLLAALKKDMIEKEGRVDQEKLRKDGFSPRLIARLENT
jgi:hypothetical protein